MGYLRWVAQPELHAATHLPPGLNLPPAEEGAFLVNSTVAGYRVSWFGLPEEVDNIRIESSSDGVQWVTVPGAMISFRTNSAEFSTPVGAGDYGLLRFQPMANRVAYGVAHVWPGLQLSELEGALLVNSTLAGYRVTWFGLPEEVDNIRIESSFDGVQWVTVPGAIISFRTASAEFSPPVGAGDYGLLRFQPMANRVTYGVAHVWPGLQLSGLATYPRARPIPTGVRVFWGLAATDDSGNTPVSFTYRYAFEEPGDWIYGSTLETHVEFASVDNSTLYVGVQSVFQDGSVGPWISAPPIQL